MNILYKAMMVCGFLAATPAAAQTVSGCGTVAVPKTDASNVAKLATAADCFAKAKTIAGGAEDARRARIKAIVPPPVVAPPVLVAPAPAWIDCAKEGAKCAMPANGRARYGANGKFAYRDLGGTFDCSSGQFGGDPAPGVAKACAYDPATIIPAAAKPAAARDRLGINVTAATYFYGEPVYANQAMSIAWLDNTKAGWPGIDPTRLTATGYPKSVTKGSPVAAILNPPAESFTTDTARTRCTMKGSGSVWFGGDYRDGTAKDGALDFTWKKGLPSAVRVWLEIRESSVADPIRDIECRLVRSDPKALFTPQLLAYLKPFGVIRFLDWNATNANPQGVTFANRSLPESVVFQGTDGVPIEHQIALVNAIGSSPYVTVPWNATADYHRGLAQMLHDGIPASRQVYIENSNEVWNYGFWHTRMAEQEGLAAKLSDNPFQAALLRYAQKTIEVMKIYAEVFADRPGQLVRVAATQNDNPWTGEQIMAFPGLADNIDAFATAPYFGHSFFSGKLEKETNIDVLMPALAGYAKDVVNGPTAKNAALARRYGKRFITYEAGQHVIEAGGVSRVTAMQRDARMERIYVDYLNDMKGATGDLVTVYSATSPISQYGAWGLREYAGQPLGETPKLRGVLGFAGQ